MTSPSTTTGATPAPGYRCTSCGREFGADTLYVALPYHADLSGRAEVVCLGDVEPIRRDQLVPVGAGDQLGQLDAGGGDGAGHENTIATLARPRHVNPTSEVLTAVDGGAVSL